jgi:alditol oxidase
VDGTSAGDPLTNWAGNRVYAATRLHEPTSIDQLQSIVRAARSLRVLGSRHSFNDIADTTGELISLARMPRVFELDRDGRTVTVDGGVRYGELAGPLHAAGFALNNLASLPHISVAGACATATHGSGDRIGNLATAVAAMELVTADGEVVTFSRGRDPEFAGAVVGLGALGAVTRLTLDLQPTFLVRQDIYEGLPFATAVERLDEITASADSVSLFTDWRGPSVDQVWLKRRVPEHDAFEAPATFFGATRATVPIHPIRRMSPEALTIQLGVPGPWHERLPHFRMDFMPSSGAELQTEYLLPRELAPDALVAVDAIRATFASLLQISEVRTVAADDLWMSTANGRASVALHFTWHPDWEAVRAVLPGIERALAPFDPRPHWGKLSTMAGEAIRSSYTQWRGFVELVERHDPRGTFRNDFLARTILDRAGPAQGLETT